MRLTSIFRREASLGHGPRASGWLRAFCLAALWLAAACLPAVAQNYPQTPYPAYQPRPTADRPPAQPAGPQVASLPAGDASFRPLSQGGPPPAGSFPGGPQRPQAVLFEPAEVIAMVGDQPILAGEITPPIDRYFQQYEGKVAPEVIAAEREKIIRQQVQREVDRKLAYLYFLQMVPPEALPEMQEKVHDVFYEEQLPKMMEAAEVETQAEMDAKLRERGSSLNQQRRVFQEQVMAAEAIRGNVPRDRTVSHEELLAYYHEHAEEYSFESQVRWEQLMVRIANYPGKAAAYRALANMGNEVLRGAPLEAVARRTSEGPNKGEGGQFDWTTQGSVVWEVVDEALFTLPVGKLSSILEDEESFHIVRVVERRQAGMVPFQEVQTEIEEKILEEYRSGKIEEFLQSLRESIPVWTIFDDRPESQEVTASRPAPAMPRQ